jgi:conserved oligomeric Golgi complex subunit 3
LHEPKLEALREVCVVLEALMVIDGGSALSGGALSSPNVLGSPPGLYEGRFQSFGTMGAKSTDDGRDEDGGEGREDEDGQEDDDGEDEDDEDDLIRPSLKLTSLLLSLLQDAQTRLFFKAQSVLQSEVRYHVWRADSGVGAGGWSVQALTGGMFL